MKGLIVRLWPKEAIPGSYFGLVRQLVDACPRLEVIKRSVCIEGPRRALARAKVHWARWMRRSWLRTATAAQGASRPGRVL